MSDKKTVGLLANPMVEGGSPITALGTAESIEEMLASLCLRPKERDSFFVKRDRWWGCYSAGWPKKMLVADAFGHPAKAARGLLERIFDHLFEEGWLSRGQTVLSAKEGQQ